MEEGSEQLTSDRLIGKLLGERYVVEELICEGAMGAIYRGTQRALDRPVAIKCVRPHLLASQEVVSRFMEEARVASHLSHPNIVRIYDFGRLPATEGGQLFIVMELLAGTDLSALLESDTALPLSRVRSIIGQVLGALSEAHAAGVTHRDVKPENVVLLKGRGREDFVKLIDFGIAKADGAQRITASGHFVGTPHYMAPEQIRGERCEENADLYGAGVMLFQMLTGKLPFDDDSVTKVLESQLFDPRPDPREVAPERDIPPALAEACSRAIDLEASRRYPNADAFASAIEQAFGGDSAHGAAAELRPSPPSSGAPVPRRGPGSPAPRSRTWASMEPPPSISTRHRIVQATDFASFQRLEREATRALDAGDIARAIRLLEKGIDRAKALTAAGEAELGTSAWTAFGRRLGALLRRVGRATESCDLLFDIAENATSSNEVRALIFEQLALSLREAGQPKHAEARRLQALHLATSTGDRSLVARLQQMAGALQPEDIARANTLQEVSVPPPRQSELRVKNGVGGNGRDRGARQRRAR